MTLLGRRPRRGSAPPRRRAGASARYFPLSGCVVLLVLGSASCGGSETRSEVASDAPRPAEAPAEALPPDPDVDDVRHLLARFTFGSRLGEAERVLAQGIEPWLTEQLGADAASDPLSVALRQRFPLAFAAPLDLLHLAPPREGQGAVGEAGAEPGPVDSGEVLFELQAALITRQTLTEHQVLEVMADFWFNHFNVNAAKGRVYLVAGQYLDDVIRRHALGTFEELLVAVATHPAMLMYLDNVRSSVERPGPGGRRGGINENFARELLELHTLGVDGGYSQRDVEEVARILSGWRQVDLGFAYLDALHDPGPKVVMGRRFPAGGGMREGVSLLRWLARHPSTVRHLSRKLAVRFVTDTPPPELVGRIADAWERTGGDVRGVLRAIVADPELWAEQNRRTKVKSALEWLVGAFRVLGVVPSDVEVRRIPNRLGQPPFAQPVPTGYPEVAAEWANGAQLSDRWQVAFQLAHGHMPGVTYAAGDPLPREGSVEEQVRFVCDRILGGASPSTERALRDRLVEAPNVHQRRILGVAMALSSPEFQRQ